MSGATREERGERSAGLVFALRMMRAMTGARWRSVHEIALMMTADREDVDWHSHYAKKKRVIRALLALEDAGIPVQVRELTPEDDDSYKHGTLLYRIVNRW